MTRRYPEPTIEQLQAALDILAAAAPGRWPTRLPDLGENAAKLVRARALQAMHDLDLASREQVPLHCTRPDGSHRTRWVFGAPTRQLALDKDLT